jgi:putative component of membrane protein insertase Oxa1/YidC/SpoIIIJ protein YidD
MNIKKSLSKYVLYIFLFLSSSFNVTAQFENSITKVKNINGRNLSGGDYISFYQQYISDIRGNDCPMYPSCSNYALESIKEKGFVLGVINGMDRLLRCGHEYKLYPSTMTDRGMRLLDSNNDSLNSVLNYKRYVDYYAYESNYSDSTLQFIQKLVSQQLYHEALLEINREFIKKGVTLDLLANELLCLNAIGKYEKVIYEFETKVTIEQKNSPKILKQYFTAYHKLENYEKIISLANIFNPEVSDENINYCKILVFNSFIKNRNVTGADFFIASQKKLTGIEEKSRQVISDLRSIKAKSPLIAGLSSTVIPGAGYLYAGHTKTAISSLLFNSLFAFATYSSFKSGNNGMGILTGLFGLAFYISNVQGSVKSAKRYNEMKYNNIVNRFEEQTITYH